MESNDKLKKISIKNHTWYFDDTIKIEDFDLDNILIDEKPYENGLVYIILYKNLIAAKPLRIRFDKTDGCIRVYDWTRYLVLFGSEKYDFIYNSVRHLTGVKSGIIMLFLIKIYKNQSRFIRFLTSKKKQWLFIIL